MLAPSDVALGCGSACVCGPASAMVGALIGTCCKVLRLRDGDSSSQICSASSDKLSVKFCMPSVITAFDSFNCCTDDAMMYVVGRAC